MECYGIREVSQQTGIHESSLRRSDDMGLITPGRIQFGTSRVRMYTEDELKLLCRVKELIDSGFQLRKAVEIARVEAEVEAEDRGYRNAEGK